MIRPVCVIFLVSSSFFSLIAADSADKIYFNAQIITVNDIQPNAEAVAVKDGRIIQVGPYQKVAAYQGQSTRLIDLGGKTLLPGFFDAHGHVLAGGLQALSANLLSPPDGDVRDIASLQKTIREWIAANRDKMNDIQLAIGFGYDNAQLRELRHPNRDDLDAIIKDIPLIIVHQSGHLLVANSKALEVAGISSTSPNPVGGVIQRRPGTQEPNGVLEETAAFPVLMKLLRRTGAKGSSAFIRAGTELWARYGYTTAQDGRSTPNIVKALQESANSGELKIDVVSYPDVLISTEAITQNVSRQYKGRFRVAGAKLTIDG
ncbi:MAG: hypothetical protein RJA81_431, partial [Planctomycetota bacterium]